MTMRDKYVGCMLGLAIGDALGFPVEFAPEGDVLVNPVQDFRPYMGFPPGTFSDDTQMTLALARALVRAGHESLESLMPVVAEEFVAWAQSADNDRAPGGSCMEGCHNLAQGVPWHRSGRRGSKGCGASMRSAPVGLYYREERDKLLQVARAQALCTHLHPTAEAGSVGTALGVWLALQGTAPHEFPARLAEVTRPISQEFADYIELVADVGNESQQSAYTRLSADGRSVGWVSEEAVATALWCLLRAPEDYKQVVLLAANSPLKADRDSIACIAGAMAGARLGVEAIPAPWRQRIEKADELVELAEALLRAAGRADPG